MPGRPPDDSEFWHEIVSQVDEALRQAEMTDEATRDALLSGVREALRSLEEAGFTVPSAGEGEAVHVEVVEGGRQDSEPPSDRERPPLRLAEDDAPDDEDDDRDDAPAPRVQTRVRVLKADEVASLVQGRAARAPLKEEGRIRLDAGEDQAIYRGAGPHPYRVACRRGRLRLLADGQPAGALREGQSADVEAALLQVLAEEPTEGAYVRL